MEINCYRTKFMINDYSFPTGEHCWEFSSKTEEKICEVKASYISKSDLMNGCDT